MDAYLKLELFGVQIYACVDVYSRRIIWAYVGTMAKTKFSVFCQYLATIEQLGRTPQVMRADHGVETPMMADAHLMFREHQEGRNIRFNEAFWYTTSKGNNTIEHWWSELAKTALNKWRDYFIHLRNAGLYNELDQADRIAFLAIYIPILRSEMWRFVNSHNNHRIRTQNDIPDHIAGIPEVLYNYPELKEREFHGVRLNTDNPTIRQWIERKDEYGMLLGRSRLRSHITGYPWLTVQISSPIFLNLLCTGSIHS